MNIIMNIVYTRIGLTFHEIFEICNFHCFNLWEINDPGQPSSDIFQISFAVFSYLLLVSILNRELISYLLSGYPGTRSYPGRSCVRIMQTSRLPTCRDHP